MDSMHDLGGRQGFGPVQRDDGPGVFHHEWEMHANAVYPAYVAAGVCNMDEYRHAIERMTPVHYLSASYFERVMTAVATLAVEKGVFTRQDLVDAAGGDFPLSRPPGPGRAAVQTTVAFAIGDRVRVKNEFVAGHTRMPGYIRGKRGVVVASSLPYPYPDAAAHGHDAHWEPTYDVAFDTRELWPDASDDAVVHVGVFRSYLVADETDASHAA